MEQITLYFRQGSSDKVYQCGIEPSGNKYVVNFTYGRRGTTMQAGTKTTVAVDYGAAKAIYEKLVKEKKAKGYTVGKDGTPYQHTEKQTTGIHCQLLNPVGENEVENLINDNAYWMQEKMDGRRLLIHKQDGQVSGINRLGLTVALPEYLSKCCGNCEEDFIIDGEIIGDMLCVFDVLLIGDDEIGGLRYGERYLRLMNLLGTFEHPNLHLVETFYLARQKGEMFDRLKNDGCEGVVFKHINAPYIAGRPNSGGDQLKYKFVETASFIVGKVNTKRSVSLLLFDGDKIVSAGNVTIPPNRMIPETGQVVECQYLYAFPESGSIYQPVYLGHREDIRAEECTVGQLKFKPEPKEKAA